MKHTALVLAAALVFNSAAVTQANQTKEASQADRVKAEVQKRGIGEKSRVKVRLRNKVEVRGYISKIEDASFDVSDTRRTAPGHPPGCREAGDHQAHGMAYLPAHVLHIASGRGSGSESNAGTAAALHDPCDLGYLHPGGDGRQAYSPHRCCLADCWKWRIEAGLGNEGERSAS